MFAGTTICPSRHTVTPDLDPPRTFSLEPLLIHTGTADHICESFQAIRNLKPEREEEEIKQGQQGQILARQTYDRSR